MPAEKFKQYYQQKKVVSSYDKQRQKNKYRQKKRQVELKIFLDLIDKQTKDKILELGCSSGFLTQHLGKITAIDTSQGMLETTKQKNPQAELIQADMFELPFKENSFDKIVVIRTWNHLTKNEFNRILPQIKKILKKQGILVFDVEEKNITRKFISIIYKIIFRTKGFKIYQYSLPEISNILHKNNFKIIKGKFLNHRIGRQIILKTKVIK